MCDVYTKQKNILFLKTIYYFLFIQISFFLLLFFFEKHLSKHCYLYKNTKKCFFIFHELKNNF